MENFWINEKDQICFWSNSHKKEIQVVKKLFEEIIWCKQIPDWAKNDENISELISDSQGKMIWCDNNTDDMINSWSPYHKWYMYFDWKNTCIVKRFRVKKDNNWKIIKSDEVEISYVDKNDIVQLKEVWVLDFL